MFPLLLRQYVVTIEGFDRVVMEKVTKQKIMLNLIFLLLPKCNVDNDSTKKYKPWLCLSYIYVLTFRK